jgi:antitoxin PrlF
MKISTVTDKGQTTVPFEIRRALKIKPRQRIEWVIGKDGTAIIRPVRSVSELAGCFKSNIQFPGLKEEKEVAARAWALAARVKEQS